LACDPVSQLLVRGRSVYLELPLVPQRSTPHLHHVSAAPQPALQGLAPSAALVHQYFAGRIQCRVFTGEGDPVRVTRPWSPGLLRWATVHPSNPIPVYADFRNPLATAVCYVTQSRESVETSLACCFSMAVVASSASVSGTTAIPSHLIHYLLLGLERPDAPISVRLGPSGDITSLHIGSSTVRVAIPAAVALRAYRSRAATRAAMRALTFAHPLTYHPTLAESARMLAATRVHHSLGPEALTPQEPIPLDAYLSVLDAESPTTTGATTGDAAGRPYFEGASDTVRALVSTVITLMDRKPHTVPDINRLLQSCPRAVSPAQWALVSDRFEFGIGLNGLVRATFFGRFPRLFETVESSSSSHPMLRVSWFGELIPHFVDPLPVQGVAGEEEDSAATPDAEFHEDPTIAEALQIPSAMRKVLYVALDVLESADTDTGGPLSLPELTHRLTSVLTAATTEDPDAVSAFGVSPKGELHDEFWNRCAPYLFRAPAHGEGANDTVAITPHGRRLAALLRRLWMYDPHTHTLSPRSTIDWTPSKPSIRDSFAAQDLLRSAALSGPEWLREAPAELRRLITAVVAAIEKGATTVAAINAALLREDAFRAEASEVDLTSYGIGRRDTLLPRFFRRIPRVFRVGELRGLSTEVSLTPFGSSLPRLLRSIEDPSTAFPSARDPQDAADASDSSHVAPEPCDTEATEEGDSAASGPSAPVAGYAERWFSARLKAREGVKERARTTPRSRSVTNTSPVSSTRLRCEPCPCSCHPPLRTHHVPRLSSAQATQCTVS